MKWGYVVTQARLSPSSVERSERNTISELIAVLYTDHSAPEILFTSPTLSFTYALTIIWISGAMYSNWSVIVSVSSLLTWTGFYTGEFQTCQLSRFYRESPWVSQFQCKSHSLTAIQANLMGSPFCCVNIYKCCSNGASDTDFLPPGTRNVVWCWEQSPNFAYHRRGQHVHETKPYTHKLCKRRLVTPG